jgi:hypothetical protein
MLLLITYLAVVKHGNKGSIVIIILGLAFVASGRVSPLLCAPCSVLVAGPATKFVTTLLWETIIHMMLWALCFKVSSLLFKDE